ncbi:hypothetical protein GCM10010401_13350 [Rarobacter faecitabidus]|uniref:beta-N-acetylhexosaminidase n=1 Tax=Rarobacter faecitabidus TaxID=13243 RepID=A0A542ZE41_RARFA|nr:glycoside hydrolase family 3 N-terminal domain-containing protein [Rarobacter faecitabidus]TQL58616.1 beta-N-acetylhexosaminidase [Rarobacter faecitabidus]
MTNSRVKRHRAGSAIAGLALALTALVGNVGAAPEAPFDAAAGPAPKSQSVSVTSPNPATAQRTAGDSSETQAVTALAATTVPTAATTAPHAATTAPATTAPLAATTAPTATAAPATKRAAAKRTTAADLPLRYQVGQIFMVGVPVSGSDQIARAAITKRHVGNVFLHGRSTAGTAAVAKRVKRLTKLATKSATLGTPLFVATDQEGGAVQVLRGKGFSTIPSAMKQSEYSSKKLTKAAKKWGGQLAKAGVNLNLAPVLDVVPSAKAAKKNPPIGYFGRNYGYGAKAAKKGIAFGRGMRAAGVGDAVKHFPGLGRVSRNTDTSAGVVDRVTGAKSGSVKVFAAAIEDGSPFVMVSSATYTRLDKKHRAVFSAKIIGGLLRGKLGFDGVVISDDLSAAAAVRGLKPADRAVKFIAAGGDMVLASADPTVVPEMVDAVLAKAKKDPKFAARVAQACDRVLAAKRGL